jgi:hypothetical protein
VLGFHDLLELAVPGFRHPRSTLNGCSWRARSARERGIRRVIFDDENRSLTRGLAYADDKSQKSKKFHLFFEIQ